jgi:hypothetical protein
MDWGHGLLTWSYHPLCRTAVFALVTLLNEISDL